MSTRIVHTLTKAGAATALTAVALTAFATPALANSFSKRVYQGTVSYDDSADRFCVRADETGVNDRAVIQVTLTPSSSSRGPSLSFYDIDTAGAECRSLATAYEDTQYKAVIKSTITFDRTTGKSTYETTNVTFYS